MKYLMLCLIAASSSLDACPSCVGRIEQDSPAFFGDDFYAPTQENQAHAANASETVSPDTLEES